MLSIIIPTWGAENYIEECLDSIQSQTNIIDIEHEIILGVDHCEKSLNKINEIKDKYNNLRVIWTESNKGLFITLNTLLTLTNYDFILKFDADDIMKPELLETIWGHRNNYDLIRFGYDFYYSKTNKNKPSPKCANGVYLMNKKILKDFGGFQPWLCSADTEFLMRYNSTNRKELLLNNKKLFYYRQHNQSLCNNEKTGMLSKIRKDYQKKYLGKPVTNIYVEPIINNYTEL